jgi:hypothetical protein
MLSLPVTRNPLSYASRSSGRHQAPGVDRGGGALKVTAQWEALGALRPPLALTTDTFSFFFFFFVTFLKM